MEVVNSPNNESFGVFSVCWHPLRADHPLGQGDRRVPIRRGTGGIFYDASNGGHARARPRDLVGSRA